MDRVKITVSTITVSGLNELSTVLTSNCLYIQDASSNSQITDISVRKLFY